MNESMYHSIFKRKPKHKNKTTTRFVNICSDNQNGKNKKNKKKTGNKSFF